MDTTETSADNAGIFATRKIGSLGPLLGAVAAEAQLSRQPEDAITYFFCDWPDLTVQLATDPNWDRRIQCAGMKDWISIQTIPQQKKAAVATLIQKINATVDCIGTAIAPGYDPEGKAASLVLAIATAFDGYIFSHQSFYDARGTKIIGDDSDPISLVESLPDADEFQVSDLVGEWIGIAPDGTICRYMFFANGSCLNLVESESFIRMFGMEGLKTKYAMRMNSPYWEFDAFDFEHERMKGMLFRAIFQPLGRDTFKLEGLPKHFGPRPSDFSHEAITFTRVVRHENRQ